MISPSFAFIADASAASEMTRMSQNVICFRFCNDQLFLIAEMLILYFSAKVRRSGLYNELFNGNFFYLSIIANSSGNYGKAKGNRCRDNHQIVRSDGSSLFFQVRPELGIDPGGIDVERIDRKGLYLTKLQIVRK